MPLFYQLKCSRVLSRLKHLPLGYWMATSHTLLLMTEEVHGPHWILYQRQNLCRMGQIRLQSISLASQVLIHLPQLMPKRSLRRFKGMDRTSNSVLSYFLWFGSRLILTEIMRMCLIHLRNTTSFFYSKLSRNWKWLLLTIFVCMSSF